MRAVVYERYGGPEALELRELPRPLPRRGQCLVQVAAASVNPADWKLLAGQWALLTGRGAPSRPRRLGVDFAGRVAGLGRGARGFAQGEKVMGQVDPLRGAGSLAEYVAVPAGALSRKPANLGLEEAAAVPLACSTAWVGLHALGRRLAGGRVLLTGAGGGVGHFAIQLAALLGAELTAVCSAGKAELCRRLGARRVLAYDGEEPLELEEGSYDLVFDCASSIPWQEARRLLRPRGLYLLLDTGGRLWPFFYGLASQLLPGPRLRTFLVRPDGSREARLARLFEQGRLQVVIGGRYLLADVQEAFRESRKGHATGKIVVIVAPRPPAAPRGPEA